MHEKSSESLFLSLINRKRPALNVADGASLILRFQLKKNLSLIIIDYPLVIQKYYLNQFF